MNAENNHEPDLSDLPQADVQSKKQISIVWLIPIVAVLIGGWLAYKGLSEKGPLVLITFESAEGLETGKTQVKYKDVKIGQVENIRFNADLSQVIISAELVRAIFDGQHPFLGRAPPGNRQRCLGSRNAIFRRLHRNGPGERGRAGQKI
jgi:hypothetical protein